MPLWEAGQSWVSVAGYSLRSCLIRAIASSTACSGVMPSVTMRWIAFAQTRSALDLVVPPLAGGAVYSSASRPRLDLHRRSDAVRIAGIEPERLVKERWHRRQNELPREVEPMREPAVGHQEADELLGGRDVATVLENQPKKAVPEIAKCSPCGPSGHSIVAVFL